MTDEVENLGHSRKRNLMLLLENASQESKGSGNEIKRNAKLNSRC